MREKPRAPIVARSPRQERQIPLTAKQFNACWIQRQLTLFYRLLPLNRRKAAQTATVVAAVLPEIPPAPQGRHCHAGGSGHGARTKISRISNACQSLRCGSPPLHRLACSDPGQAAGIALMFQSPGLVRLAAE